MASYEHHGSRAADLASNRSRGPDRAPTGHGDLGEGREIMDRAHPSSSGSRSKHQRGSRSPEPRDDHNTSGRVRWRGAGDEDERQTRRRYETGDTEPEKERRDRQDRRSRDRRSERGRSASEQRHDRRNARSADRPSRDRRPKRGRSASESSVEYSEWEEEPRGQRHRRRSTGVRRERSAKRRPETSGRSDKAANGAGSMGQDSNLPGGNLCESIEALRTELRAVRERMPLVISSHLSQDRLPQHGPETLPLGASGSAASSMYAEPQPSNAELARIARTIHEKIIGNHPLPLYRGCSEGERSEVNDPVLFQEHVEKYLAYWGVGSYRLPPDVQAGGRKWVTRSDQFTGQRRDLLMKLIPTHLDMHFLLSCTNPVTVYRITGEHDEVPASEVTATDWLRLLVREDCSHRQGRAATLKALNGITRTPDETVSAAALRLTDAFRAAVADRDRPHATERLFFWRYISESRLKNLMQRLNVMVMPEESDRVGHKFAVLSHICGASEKLKRHPVVDNNPMGPAMCERGTLTEGIFRELVDILTVAARLSLEPDDLPDVGDDAFMAIAPP